MKIKLTKHFADLDGKEIKEQPNMGKQLANGLMKYTANEDPIRVYELAIKLNSGKEFEASVSDVELLKEFVKSGTVKMQNGDKEPVFSMMGQAQLLLALK